MTDSYASWETNTKISVLKSVIYNNYSGAKNEGENISEMEIMLNYLYILKDQLDGKMKIQFFFAGAYRVCGKI